jgi:hypothetical protein
MRANTRSPAPLHQELLLAAPGADHELVAGFLSFLVFV